MVWPHLRLPPGLGRAFWLALLLVGGVEASLHSEAVIHRYRAVFALGRAYDNLHFAERHPPRILFVGNSRADNGIDPRTVSRAWPDAHQDGFNLGVPGANAIVYHGMVKRLDTHGLLGGKAIHSVVLVLDENTFQEDNSLGYLGFLADRRALFEAGRYQDWLGSYLRLWSYSDNLRQLREPEKALRFIQASLHSLDPIGGRGALPGLSCGVSRHSERGAGTAPGAHRTAAARRRGRGLPVACHRPVAGARRARAGDHPAAA